VGEFEVPQRFDALAVRASDDGLVWPVVAMEVVVAGERPVPTNLLITYDKARVFSEHSVIIHGTDSGSAFRPINDSLLREISLKRLAERAMLGVAYRVTRYTDSAGLPRAEVEPAILPASRDKAGFYSVDGNNYPQRDTLDGLYDPWLVRMETLTFEELAHMGLINNVSASAARATVSRRGKRITDELLASVRDIYRQAMAERKPPKKTVATALYVSESTAGRYIQRAREKGLLGTTRPGKKGETAT
jgi:hypothetical protein